MSHSARFFPLRILWHYSIFPHHATWNFLTGCKSGDIIFLSLTLRINGHLEAMNQNWLDTDRGNVYRAFGACQLPQSQSCLYNQRYIYLQIKFTAESRDLRWSLSHFRGHMGLKVGMWGLLAWGSMYSKSERCQKRSVFFVGLTLIGPVVSNKKSFVGCRVF